MPYTKHIWECGEMITDAKMNNIEDGIDEALECCDGGIDIIIQQDGESAVIVKGDFDTIYNKVANHEICTGIFIANGTYSSQNTMDIAYLQQLRSIPASGSNRITLVFFRTLYAGSSRILHIRDDFEWTEGIGITLQSQAIAEVGNQ